MIQANQALVVQNTNFGLVGLRAAEVSYFASFYGTFGTQSALMAGLIITGITQVPGNTTTSGTPTFFLYLYWVSSTLGFASAMHVLICCVFIAVYAQGFALRGPAGSMAVAVKGMVEEQEEVVSIFIFAILCISVSTIGIFWIMANQIGAIVATILIIFGTAEWLKYTLRIYNRFKFEKEDEHIRFKGKDHHLEYSIKANDDIMANPTQQKTVADSQAHLNWKNNKLTSFTNLFTSHTNSHGNNIAQEEQNAPKKLPSVDRKEQKGYVTMDVGSVLFGNPWKRRYCVLSNSSLYIFNDEAEYIANPEAPINGRPFSLEGVTLQIISHEPPVELKLKPVDEDTDVRKPVVFRCDTVVDASAWIDAIYAELRKVSSSETHTNSPLH